MSTLDYYIDKFEKFVAVALWVGAICYAQHALGLEVYAPHQPDDFTMAIIMYYAAKGLWSNVPYWFSRGAAQ